MNIRSFPEPEWGISQRAYKDCSSLVAIAKTPFIITGVLVRLLQYHFSSADNIEKEQLKNYIWTEDASTSAIYIAPHTLRDNRTVQQRPAIYIKREEFTPQQISLKNQTVTAVNRDTGKLEGKKCQVQLQGSHSIVVFGKTGAEADNLAEEVFFRMLHYSPVMRDDLRVGSWQVGGMGSVQEVADESGKMFIVALRITWANIHRWMIVPDTPAFTRLNVVLDPTQETTNVDSG